MNSPQFRQRDGGITMIVAEFTYLELKRLVVESFGFVISSFAFTRFGQIDKRSRQLEVIITVNTLLHLE